MSDGRADDRGLSSDDLDLLQHLLADEGVAPARGAPSLVRRLPGERVPLSFSQELLWLLEQASPGLVAYNIGNARRLIGRLDMPAFERALRLLVDRHEILRTRFGLVDGEPSQLVDPHGLGALEVVDLGALDGEAREAALTRELRARARVPFAFATGHLWRASLVRLTPTDQVLLLVSHHAAVDGWSIGILMRELATLYRAELRQEEAGLAPMALQFGDFALWQRRVLQGAHLASLLDYWRVQLASAQEPLLLPSDFPRQATLTFAGASRGISLSADELDALKAFGRTQDATLYMVLLAIYATVLHRYSGRTDVLVGSGVAGRMEPGVEPIVGYFNNTVVQRADFSGDPTFAELLERVRVSVLGAFDHQEVPLEKLVLDLREGQPSAGNESLFQAVFTMQDPRGTPLDLEGLEVHPYAVDTGETKFDITLLPNERDGGIRLSVHFRSDLFLGTTMDRFLGHMRQVMREVERDATVRVSALRLVTDDEQGAVEAANATRTDEGAAATIVSLFEATAARVGDRTAVTDGTTALTFSQLNARANQLAHRLREAGIARGTPVGLALDRSTDAIVGLLGILKAGGCYVPTPPEQPPVRVAQQLAESGARVVVSHAVHAGRLPEGITLVALDRDATDLAARPAANAARVASPDDLAYVLFTSGSTGTPKGVAVSHANIVHYARAVARVLAAVPADVPGAGFATLDGWHFGQVSTLGADLGNTSLVPALLAGGTLHVMPNAVTTEPQRFADYLRDHPLDLLKITPSHLRALVAGGTGAALVPLLPRRWVVLGGEALGLDLARTLLSAGSCRVLNHYGPTETTVGVLTFEVTSDSLAAVSALGAQTVPIGRPLGNTGAHVVDALGMEQPAGVPGELWISGAGVSQGYLGRDDLTAERFTMRGAERVYRTGDRVRRLSDQSIEFLGRVDEQVKVRGYRVELGEIAQGLRAHDEVEAAEVVLRPESDEPQLVGYVVLKRSGYAASHGERVTGEGLVRFLSGRLPDHMVPSLVMLIEAMPLTANGKVDRAKLPVPGVQAEEAVVAPRTETERRLLEIWRDVLKKPEIGVTQRFADLGGHSLLAIRILGKISKGFGVRLSLGTLFETPTVEKLAELLEVELQLAALDALGAGDPPAS